VSVELNLLLLFNSRDGNFCELSFFWYFTVPDGAEPVELDVFYFKGPGVALSMYNVDEVW
jgi:hypothetical protein